MPGTRSRSRRVKCNHMHMHVHVVNMCGLLSISIQGEKVKYIAINIAIYCRTSAALYHCFSSSTTASARGCSWLPAWPWTTWSWHTRLCMTLSVMFQLDHLNHTILWHDRVCFSRLCDCVCVRANTMCCCHRSATMPACGGVRRCADHRHSLGTDMLSRGWLPTRLLLQYGSTCTSTFRNQFPAEDRKFDPIKVW